MAFCLQPRQGTQPKVWQRELWEGSLGRAHPEREVDVGQGEGALTVGAPLVQGERLGAAQRTWTPWCLLLGDF